jgi:hypothetical protein
MSAIEALIDEATQQICADLRGLHVEAQIAAGRPPSPRVGRRLFSREAHGFIDVQNSPISWISVVLCVTTAPDADSWTAVVSRYDKYVRYAVRDSHLTPKSRKIRVSLACVRSPRLRSGVTDLEWRGRDAGTGLAARLNAGNQAKAAMLQDLDLRNALYTQMSPVWISAHPSEGLWLIWTPWPTGFAYPLSTGLWRAYESVAAELAATSRPG